MFSLTAVKQRFTSLIIDFATKKLWRRLNAWIQAWATRGMQQRL